ncbi:hypothetical protein Agub_g5804 [Astrephomene gubernaculifera]|uniref:Peptidase S54 rhomboid domain-containing protein n=1 Tax=Astrephomene gubernaculifera TaxID=47775 RepID=A0AAD3DMD7_9CHLO|nr:hypothetical protein Agub_g5804 [Astrephomene gubernaculifera]
MAAPRAGGRSIQLLLGRAFGVNEPCRIAPWLASSSDEPSTSTNVSSSRESNGAPSGSPPLLSAGVASRGTGCLPTLRSKCVPVLSSSLCASQKRLMSWRRYVPTFGDFQNGAQDPYRQVTNLFLALNIATFILAKYDRGIVVNMAAIPYSIAKGEYYRLLTSGFLHTDFIHLLTNMLTLHWLGPELESACGRSRFAAIFVVSIISGGWLQYTMGPFASVAWGASGGIYGLFAAYLVYRLRNRNFISWEAHDMQWLAQVVGLNVLLAFMAGGSLAHWCHLGGALGGAAVCWLAGPRYRWQGGRLVDSPLLPWFAPRR